jgi:hypothetical protein
VWNPNGRELFYRNGDKMMAVDITTQPRFSSGKPRELFAGEYLEQGQAGIQYDVSPDGLRFLTGEGQRTSHVSDANQRRAELV